MIIKNGFQVCGYEKNKSYFATGAAGVFAAPGTAAGAAGGAAGLGATGTVCLVTGVDTPSIKPEVFLDAVYVNVMDVSMKMMATAAVIFPRKVPAPLEPNTV